MGGFITATVIWKCLLLCCTNGLETCRSVALSTRCMLQSTSVAAGTNGKHDCATSTFFNT